MLDSAIPAHNGDASKKESARILVAHAGHMQDLQKLRLSGQMVVKIPSQYTPVMIGSLS